MACGTFRLQSLFTLRKAWLHVIVVDDKVVVDFDPAKLKSALGIEGSRHNPSMRAIRVLPLLATLLLPWSATAQEHVSFPTQDGGVVYADVYGEGPRGVVLAHGGQFNKESWRLQALTLVKAGFRALAFDFRGYGQSRGPGQSDLYTAPLQLDVLAAVRYLRKTGATSVSVIGASIGGEAAADASIEAEPGEIDRLVLLAGWTDRSPEKMKCRKLFIVARDDTNGSGLRLPRIRECYDKTPEPKQLVILNGSAHAQFLFATDQGDRVMREILRFLSAH